MRISDWSSDVCSSDLDAAPEQRQSAAKSIRMRRSRLTPANCRYLVIECVIVSFLWKINSELAGLPIGQRYLKGRFGAGVGEKNRPAVEHCGEIVVHRIDQRRQIGRAACRDRVCQ